MASWTALGSSDMAARLFPFLKEQMFAIEWSFSSWHVKVYINDFAIGLKAYLRLEKKQF